MLRNKRATKPGGAPVTREFLAANTLFYGFLFVGILFFWNWFNLHSPAFTALGPETVSLAWAFIDAALPLLCGTMGFSLIRATSKPPLPDRKFQFEAAPLLLCGNP